MNSLFDIGGCSLYVDGTQLFNHRPIARAGENRVVNPDSTVVLDGAESYDVDGQVVSFNWDQLSGEEVSIISPDEDDPAELFLGFAISPRIPANCLI